MDAEPDAAAIDAEPNAATPCLREALEALIVVRIGLEAFQGQLQGLEAELADAASPAPAPTSPAPTLVHTALDRSLAALQAMLLPAVRVQPGSLPYDPQPVRRPGWVYEKWSKIRQIYKEEQKRRAKKKESQRRDKIRRRSLTGWPLPPLGGAIYRR